MQVLGAITLVLFVVSLQQRKKEPFLLLQTIGTLLFIVQYVLTNRITGAITFAIVAIRGLVFYFYKRKDMKPSLVVLIAFLASLIAATCFSWQSVWSIVPLIATLVKTWGTWQDDMKWARRTSLIGQSCMIIYNLIALMFTGALTEACNCISSMIAIWRYDIKKDNKDKITITDKT